MSTGMARINLRIFGLAIIAQGLLAQHPLQSPAPLHYQVINPAEPALGSEHAFRLRHAHSDGLGQTHGHFNQHYKGVRVWGGDAITHVDRHGHELPMTQASYRDILLNVTPELSEPEALAIVLQQLAPKGTFALAPQVERVVFPQEAEVVTHRDRGARSGQDLNAEDITRQVVRFHLAYHVHTELDNDRDGIRHTDFILDAHTGAILRAWNTLHTTGAVGTGKSQYSDVVSINTNVTPTGFELRDMTRGAGGTYGNNVVTNANHATSTTASGEAVYANATNAWGDGVNYVEGTSTTAPNGQTAAVDAMFGMMKSWDFYKNVLNRNGIDGAGTATHSRVHYGTAYDNAFWTDACFCMTYGDGAHFSTLTPLDVAGHEMSHGVCARTANLTYSGESGGLNEANSDIFGTLIEFYARGGSGSTIGDTGGNFTIGEQLASTPLRYMHKPSLDGASPDAWSPALGHGNLRRLR